MSVSDNGGTGSGSNEVAGGRGVEEERLKGLKWQWRKVELNNRLGDGTEFDLSTGSSFLWQEKNERLFCVTRPRRDLEIGCFKLPKGGSTAVLEKIFRCGQEPDQGVASNDLIPIVSQCDVTLFRVRPEAGANAAQQEGALHYLVIFTTSNEETIATRFFQTPSNMAAQDVYYDPEQDAAWVLASERAKRNVHILRIPCFRTRAEATSSSLTSISKVVLEDLFYDVSLQLGVAFFIDPSSPYLHFVTLGESKDSSSPVGLYSKSFDRRTGELRNSFSWSVVDIAPFINDFIKSEVGDKTKEEEKSREVGLRVTNWRSQFISCQYGLAPSGVLLSAGFNLELSWKSTEGTTETRKRSHCCFAKIYEEPSSSTPDATPAPAVAFKSLGTCLQEHVILSYFTQDLVLQMDENHCKVYALEAPSSSGFRSFTDCPKVEIAKPEDIKHEIMSIWNPGYYQQPLGSVVVVAQALEEENQPMPKPLVDVFLLEAIN